MIHNLQFRLLMSFILVIILTIGSASFFVARSSWDEIKRYEEFNNSARISRVTSIVSRYYYVNQGWDGIQPLVEQIGTIEEKRIILIDSNSITIADSQNNLVGKDYRSTDAGEDLYLPVISIPSQSSDSSNFLSNLKIGTLYITPHSEST